MLEAEEWRKRSFKRIHQLRQHEAAKKSFACTEALSMKNVLLLRDRTKREGARDRAGRSTARGLRNHGLRADPALRELEF